MDTVAYPDPAFRPSIVANRNTVFLFFTNPTYSPVRMISSTDGGTTFGSVRDISSELASEITWASISGDTVALIYPRQDGYRYILRSTDHGISWSRTNEDLYIEDRIALCPKFLHLAKHGVYGNTGEVVYKRSSNLGTSWQIDTLLTENDGYYSDVPSISAYESKCGTELLMAWRDTKYGYGFLGASIIARAGLAGGKLWLPEQVLTNMLYGTEPQTAIRQNVRAVAWIEEVTPVDTLHAAVRATNSSLTDYCPEKDLTPDVSRGIWPRIAVSSHAVHVVWEQLVDGNSGTFRIFYRRGEIIPSHSSFSLSTGLISFDTTEINDTRTDSVTVSNDGSESLVIGTAIADDENFTVTPSGTTIVPSGSAIFYIHFTPKSFGTHYGKIIFYHNGRTSPDCFTVNGEGKWNRDLIVYRRNIWNLVSIPVKPGPIQTLPHLFSFDGSYTRRDTMVFGRGYWSKPDDTLAYFMGVKIYSESVAVKPGWNLVGSISKPIPRSNLIAVPDSIITSALFEYNGNLYIAADTLYPGRGYWIKVKQSGKILLK